MSPHRRNKSQFHEKKFQGSSSINTHPELAVDDSILESSLAKYS